MALFSFALAGGMLYAGLKSYQQVQRNKKLAATLNPTEQRLPASHPVVALVNQVDQAYQRVIQQKIDPLLTGSNRQKQLSLLRGDNDPLTISSPSQEEQQINRYIGLAGVTMGLATLGSYLFPPLLVPTMALGIYLMLPLYQRAFQSLIQERKIGLDLLGSLYMTSFWLVGYYAFAALAYGLYFTGIKIIYQLEGRSRENLTHLFGQQPRFVWRVVDGVEVQIPFNELQVGDVVVVNAGEALPVDGVVVDGLGSVDQHMLTGESQPVEKEADDTVFASTLVLSGRLFIQVEKAGENTLTAQIGQILEQTASYQTDAELKGQQLADKTVLPNIAVSLLALPLVGPIGAVAVLGTGFGTNMRFVSLLSTMNYLTIASRHNILIKDGRALDRLKDVDTIVFDKTGTLTLEQPHVARLHVIQPGLSEADLLIYAAAAEYRQPHPIAKAIINAAVERGLELPQIEEASYQVGYGITVQIQEKLIRVGSSRFMHQEGLPMPSELTRLQTTCQAQGYTLVLVAIDNQVVGALELHATIRPEAKQIIQTLRQRKLSMAIISGDQEEPTQKLAAELGIESYFANTLPENKANLIKAFQEAGRVVCFIGDGINDAIAMKKAQVSISLRGATSVATDLAQIVLMDGSLSHLCGLFDVAKNLETQLQNGLIMSIAPLPIVIVGGFLFHFGVLSSIVVNQIAIWSAVSYAMNAKLKDEKTTLKVSSEKTRDLGHS